MYTHTKGLSMSTRVIDSTAATDIGLNMLGYAAITSEVNQRKDQEIKLGLR
jgi:hypothetical protein